MQVAGTSAGNRTLIKQPLQQTPICQQKEAGKGEVQYRVKGYYRAFAIPCRLEYLFVSP